MSDTTAEWVGKKLAAGRYAVTEKLGEGGMGAVYRVWDKNLETEVVLKVPKRSMLDDPEFAGRFQREIRSLVKLSHPNIVKIQDVGEFEGMPFCVMQLLSGGDLKGRCTRAEDGQGQAMSPASLSSWLPGVADALDFIHQQNFVHRDVKPANILFDAHGNPYLSDFGVAKVISENVATEAMLTGAGIVLGTPEYMAPEMVLGDPFDGCADQYALAVTVYEVLAGRLPLTGPTSTAILVKQTTQRPRPLCDVVPSIPRALSDAVMQALAKNPDERFLDCRSFAQAALAGAAEATSASGSAQAEPTAKLPRLACPSCECEYELAEEWRGRQFRCSACQAEIEVSLSGPLALKLLVQPPTEEERLAQEAAELEAQRQAAKQAELEAQRQAELEAQRLAAKQTELEAQRREEEKKKAQLRAKEAKQRAEQERQDAQRRAEAEKLRLDRQREWELTWRQLKTAAPYVVAISAALVLVIFGFARWRLSFEHDEAVQQLATEMQQQLDRKEFQQAINKVRSVPTDIAADSAIQSLVERATAGIRDQKIETVAAELTRTLENGEAETVVEFVRRQPNDLVSDPKINALLEAANKTIANKVAIDQLVKDVDLDLERGGYEAALKRLEVASADIKAAPQVKLRFGRAVQGRDFAAKCSDIEQTPFHQDVQPLLSAARKLAQSVSERQRVDQLEKVWSSGRVADIKKREAELALVVNDLATMLDSARQRRPTNEEKFNEAKKRLAGLRTSFTKFGLPVVKFKTAETTIESIAAWSAVTNRFSQLESDLREMNADEQSLTTLANQLAVEIAPIVPDRDWKTLVEQAPSSLPLWKRVLQLQRSLQERESFLKSPRPDHWKELPLSTVWPAGEKFLEMIRQRDATIKGTAAWDFKENFQRVEIADLWAFRQIGSENPYYSSKQPLPDGNQTIPVLLKLNELFNDRAFKGTIKDIQKAPQSLFAEQVSTIWTRSDKSTWHEAVATC